MIVHKIDPQCPDPGVIREAADAIRRGELVVFPTETVYGLAADALDEAAVQRVYDAKGRAETHALPVQIASVDQLSRVTSFVPEAAIALAGKFWPGPLTLVMPKSDSIPDAVTGGGPKIGVRIPDHPIALALLEELGSPIVATSANMHGRPPATGVGCAMRGFGNMLSVVLDGGKCAIGVPSTVIDVSVVPPKVLRHGAISADEIRKVVGEVDECTE